MKLKSRGNNVTTLDLIGQMLSFSEKLFTRLFGSLISLLLFIHSFFFLCCAFIFIIYYIYYTYMYMYDRDCYHVDK